MGTDIHNTFEKKVADRWVEIDIDTDNWDSPYHLRRHYLLFSVLANVRNGFGFGGVHTYTPVTPIAMPRGLPEGYDDGDFKWGEHSQSWLLGSEILNYFKDSNHSSRTGVVSKEFYDSWGGVSSPEVWSGGVVGSDVTICENLEDANNPKYTHYRISWDIDLLDELDYFKEMIEELVDEHGEIRMVFGFDS